MHVLNCEKIFLLRFEEEEEEEKIGFKKEETTEVMAAETRNHNGKKEGS